MAKARPFTSTQNFSSKPMKHHGAPDMSKAAKSVVKASKKAGVSHAKGNEPKREA
jgi:hypothetical protein